MQAPVILGWFKSLLRTTVLIVEARNKTPDRDRFIEFTMKSPKKIRVLLIDELDDYLALVIVRCLQQTGNYEIHCVTADPAHRLRYSVRCKVRQTLLDGPAALLDAVRHYHADLPVDIVIPIQENMITMAGAVANELNTFTKLAPIPTPDLCDAIDNKWRLFELLSGTTIKEPRSLLFSGKRAAIEQELSTWDGPFLVKPPYGHGGEGIRKYDSREDLLEDLYSRPLTTKDPLVIQEFIPGSDLGCNIISWHGEVLAHTIQRATLAQNKPYTSGLGLEFRHDEAIFTIAKEFARTSGWSGIANIDLRLDERSGDLYLLEINPRYWQTLLGSLAMGINFPDMHCRLALGESVEDRPFREGKWVNLHALSYDLVNVKRLLVSREYSWCCVDIRHALSDPFIEGLFFLTALRRHLKVKARASVTREQKPRISPETVVD